MKKKTEVKVELESINIYSSTPYGEEKRKYFGTVKFTSGKTDKFECAISNDEVDKYLAPIRDSIIKSATELGGRLAESLKVDS